MIPRARASGDSVAIRLTVPRGLNDPVFWRCSGLRYSRSSPRRTPVAAVVQVAAVDELSVGVRWTRPDEPLAGGLDLRQADDVVESLGHAGEYAHARSQPDTCVFAQAMISFSAMLDRLPVSAEPERLRYAAVGRALADPKRLCVLESLAIGELSVTDLSERVGCQVPNMSQHLAVLRSAGLVTTRREGSTVFYRLADPRVLEAYRLIQDIAR